MRVSICAILGALIKKVRRVVSVECEENSGVDIAKTCSRNTVRCGSS